MGFQLGYFLWGLAGGAAVLGIDFWTAMRKSRGKWPIQYSRVGYWLGEAVRVIVGGVLAVVLGESHQVTTPLGAFTIGVAAPLILEKIGSNLTA